MSVAHERCLGVDAEVTEARAECALHLAKCYCVEAVHLKSLRASGAECTWHPCCATPRGGQHRAKLKVAHTSGSKVLERVALIGAAIDVYESAPTEPRKTLTLLACWHEHTLNRVG